MARVTKKQVEEVKTRGRLQPGNPRFFSREFLQAFLEGRLVPLDEKTLGGRIIDVSHYVEWLIRAGYHKVTDGGKGMRAAAYRKLWPNAVTQPLEYTMRFDELLLVDRTIAISELVARSAVDVKPILAACVDEVAAPLYSRYIAFVQLGERNFHRTVNDCCKTFAPDEVGLVTIEGLHLPIEHEKYLREYCGVDLAGSRFELSLAPFVQWRDKSRPFIDIHSIYHPFEYHGSASRGGKLIPVTEA